jgi:hypothetical protein
VSPRRHEFRVAVRRDSGAFPDMKVIDVPTETLICGDVVDESHRLGVLTLIQNLGLRVVSMNQIPDWSGWNREDTAPFFTVFARAVRRLLLHESEPAARSHRKIEDVERVATHQSPGRE